MKKPLILSTTLFLFLIPVLASAQLGNLNIPETYTTPEILYLVIIPVIGIFVIFWSIFTKITHRRIISAIIGIVIAVVLLFMGYLSSIVSYLVPYITDLGVAGLFIILAVVFFLLGSRTSLSPVSFSRAIAGKYRKEGRERGKIIGKMGGIDKKINRLQGQKSDFESERSDYSLISEDLSGYMKRGDVPDDVWGEVQRRLGRKFRKPSDALNWLNREIKRRDNLISRLEIQIAKLKEQRTGKAEELKKEV